MSEWTANPEFLGEYVAFWQKSMAEWQKRYDNLSAQEKWFMIVKKDGTKVGARANIHAFNYLLSYAGSTNHTNSYTHSHTLTARAHTIYW